jgi:hypothetical protein
MLQLVVDHLGEIGKRNGDTLAFLTPPELLPGPMRDEGPEGLFDFGLAHGQAGVLAFLATLHRAGICRDATVALMEPLAAWLLRHAQNDTLSAFPRALRPAGDTIAGRFGWCRGDAGIALALLRAARTCGRDDWESTALALLRRGASRVVANSSVFDACVCHGSLGLHLIFRAAYAMTEDPLLDSAARYWLDVTRDFRSHDTETGFRFASTLMPEELIGPKGFLMGSAGAAMALALDQCDRRDWQRLLLIDDDRAFS